MSSAERRPATAVEPDAQELPILFLHGIDRHYRQGDVTLEILRGAEFAIWPSASGKKFAPVPVTQMLMMEPPGAGFLSELIVPS